MSSTNITAEFLLRRRWFRSKARKVQGIRIRDTIALAGTDASIVLLDVEFEEGNAETYLLTVAGAAQNHENDALWNPKFTAALLSAVADEMSFEGEHGRIAACHTPAFKRILGGHPIDLPAKVSKAEQSNSSVFYGDRFILKLFRRIEPGINPDFEIGRFLTERGFERTPAVVGHIEYRSRDSEPMSVCLLQQFVPNEGDAWEYTLEAAAEFFERNAEVQPPPTEHPMELLRVQPPSEAVNLIGAYLESARLLGERTAQMHIALSAGGGDPDFEPEPFSTEFRDQLHKRLLAEAGTSIGLIRDKQETLTGRAKEDASRLLELEPRIRETFDQVRKNPIHALRIRHHGDYHLGQVLYTGDDFFIIDFEGEPARSLEERRMKHAAMRDVAGMIRSFQYAAYSALRQREAEPGEAGDKRAAFWTAWVSRAFLEGYFKLAEGHPFLSSDVNERKLLFDVFVLEKALYEVAYELNNRPDWVGIPLRGITGLMT